MEERTTPLRVRMIEDMRIRGMGDKARDKPMFGRSRTSQGS